MIVWGTGTPKREFLHVDDFADACLHILRLDDASFNALVSGNETPLVNIGCGEDISIEKLALLIKDIVGYAGEIVFDKDKPDGTPQKLLDVSKLTQLGWQPSISLKEGISRTYAWCLENRLFQ